MSLKYLLRNSTFVGLAALTVAGCSDPVLESGTVAEKRFVPVYATRQLESVVADYKVFSRMVEVEKGPYWQIDLHGSLDGEETTRTICVPPDMYRELDVGMRFDAKGADYSCD